MLFSKNLCRYHQRNDVLFHQHALLDLENATPKTLHPEVILELKQLSARWIFLTAKTAGVRNLHHFFLSKSVLAKFFGASKTEDNHRKKVGREKCQIDFFGRGVQGILWYAKILGSRNPYTSLSIKYHPNFTFPGSVRWIFHIFQGTNPWDPLGKLEHHLEKCRLGWDMDSFPGG